MTPDFTPFFEQYEALVKQADEAFAKVKEMHPDEVKCEKACADCCHALFDLSLIEALYINHHFNRVYTENDARTKLLEKANEADRKTYRIKKEAAQAVVKGRELDHVFSRIAWERVRCPLLNDNDRCDLYEHRPITCRLYGIPTAIDGKGHTCGKSGFEEGKPYPTVNLDAINDRLYKISEALVKSIPTKYTKMADMLVPLSMALITAYGAEYLGLEEPGEKK